MELFDWLFGPRGPHVPTRTRLWLTKAAKFRELAGWAAPDPRVNHDAIVLVAHFPETLEILQVVAERFRNGRPVVATLAGNVTDTLQSLDLRTSNVVLFAIGERHPHVTFDDSLIADIAALPHSCHVDYYLSLEDVVIRKFAGDWVMNTLRTLDMKEDEAIESNMVSRRILKAQQKIANKIEPVQDDSRSAEEWMQRHCPSL